MPAFFVCGADKPDSFFYTFYFEKQIVGTRFAYIDITNKQLKKAAEVYLIMSTMTPKLQPIVNNLSDYERADIARLLIHANDLYQAHNNAATPNKDRQISLDHALKLITQVIEFDPNNAPAMNLLGRIELDRGNISAAKALFSRCLEHSPENTQYLANTGYLHIMSDSPELALNYFQKALNIDSSYKNAFLGMARAHHALHHYDVAYLHYRSLISHGYDSKPVLQGMLNCCTHLNIDSYQPELEADLFALFAVEDFAHERLNYFAAKLISKKYDLENPNAPIDIIEVANDPLVYHSLIKCSLPNPHVEEFICLLRQSIMQEAAETGSLRDELQTLAIAISVYSERNNYAMTVNEYEQNNISQINQILNNTLQGSWATDDVAGALIILGMYQAFFSQQYAVKLTRLSLQDWPSALQASLEPSLYRRAEREAFKQQFPEKQEELLIASDDLPAPFPRWNTIDFYNQQSLKQELVSNFDIDPQLLPDRLLLLVAGTDASQRAFEYARHFTDVDILAVENSLENLAENHLKAKSENLSNIAFWPVSLTKRFLEDGNAVHFASISSESETIDSHFVELLKKSLPKKGVMNIKLVESPDSATIDIQALITKQQLCNSSANIRALRATILADKYSAYWSGLINNEYFYSIDGCRKFWFNPQDQLDLLDVTEDLANQSEWSLSKILNHHGKVVSTTLAKKNLLKYSRDKHISNNCSVYFIKN